MFKIQKIYRNKVRVMMTEDELRTVDEVVAKSGVSLSFIADNALIDFISSKQPIAEKNDRRHKGYEGARKDKRKDLFIGDKADALLTICCSKNKVSRSNLTAQAILYYIKQKEGK